MIIKDFFWFKKEQYEERIKDCVKYSNERIHSKRVQTSRQHYDAHWSIGTGLICCFSTGGLTLGMSLYGYRKRSVSKRKLVLLEKEAERRSMKKYEGRKRDFWISCISNSMSYCIGCGINSCIPDSMFTDASALSFQDAVEKTEEKSEAGEQAKSSITNSDIAANLPEAGEHGNKPISRVHVPSRDGEEVDSEYRIAMELKAHGEEPTVTEVASNQVATSALREGSKKSSTKLADGKKREAWKRRFCVSCISNILENYIGCGADSCVTNMLTQAQAPPSVQNMAQMVIPPSDGAERGQDRVAVERLTEKEETLGVELVSSEMTNSASDSVRKKSSTRLGNWKKYGSRKRHFWISCMSNSVGYCIGYEVDSCLPDIVTETQVPSVQHVVQMNNEPSASKEQTKKFITVQMTDNALESAGEMGRKQNKRVQVPSLDEAEAGEYVSIAVEPQEEETNDINLAAIRRQVQH